MNSATTFITLFLGCIILQGSGVTATGRRIPDTQRKLTGLVSSPTGSQRLLTDRNMAKQHLAQPCSCDNPCSEGSCSTAGAAGVNVGTVCVLEEDAFINDIPLVDVKPIVCASNDTSVCVAADMLSGFASHELVFEKHVLAPVLCDSSGSCATKGHIVNYKGMGMMMGRYCDIVGCQQKIMPVNSPKYSRALKVKSNSPDMHFTAFAARFETRGEEAVLAAAIRVGL